MLHCQQLASILLSALHRTRLYTRPAHLSGTVLPGGWAHQLSDMLVGELAMPAGTCWPAAPTGPCQRRMKPRLQR